MNNQTKYIEIVYIGEEESETAFDILEYGGEEDLFKYMKDYEDEVEINENSFYDYLPFGDEDQIVEDGDYILGYNGRLGYIHLMKKVNTTETII